jgi:hypothetical protein
VKQVKIENKLRDYQDRLRDEGWRIKWIPWQESGRPEYVYNTPLTMLTGLGGAALFIGAAIWMVVSKTVEWPIFAAAMAGLVVVILGRLYAAFRKQYKWICINALCIDREIRQCSVVSEGNMNYVWEYRVICKFTLNGKDYKVTPEASHVVSFNSADAAQDYLINKIKSDNKCLLWIDPENPLHAVFDKKQRI